jgi:hypothetical protein
VKGRWPLIACLAGFASLGSGCRSGERAAPAPSASARATATETHGASPSVPSAKDDGGGDASGDTTTDAEEAYATAKAIGGKSIGHTSVVFKVKLEGGKDAAWKPRSKRGALRYKGEIAAYRLGVALGLANVPRAIPRAFSKGALVAALGGGASDAGGLLEREAIPDDHGDVPGALIPWIPHLEFMALEAEPLLSEWKSWLDGPTDPAPEKRGLAAQISTLIVFDYITGNWDRWSGGNIGFDKAHDRLLFIDNDGAFYDEPPRGPLEAQRGRLLALRRFSRTFTERLRALDAAALAAAIGDEDGAPLLHKKALEGVAERRLAALHMIDARIAATSASKTLAFE